MRPVRNKIRVATKTPVKLYPNLKNVEQNKVQDPVQVFCRLRPNPSYETNACISLLSHTNLLLIPPDDLKNRKTVQYSFNHIFTEDVSQKEIFDDVAMPLMVGLMQGKNGLLFTYGVTGSGKTYTMTGESNSPGIIPRCITALYNTVGSRQTVKFIVKPDRMNGFDIQSESEAFEERILESKVKHRPMKKNSSDSGILNNEDSTIIPHGNKSCLYAVFVTYIEIYNNIAYDLLDENVGSKSLQAKLLREDTDHNVYVNGAVEIEVKTAEEAMELYALGKKRKRMAQTVLNSESSRSHSIFTIRVVTVPTMTGVSDRIVKDSNLLNVAQLSLVDLAGSERCSRTQTTGQRLKEAGRINNSLMSLRTCLEVLRDNQCTGSSRIVPYRESRLTHLFKNYFEGEGKVEMIVCVNPSSRNYDEIVHVMKFAEITQEVKVLRPEIKELETEMVIPKISHGPTAVSISVQTDFDLMFPNKITPNKYFPRARQINPETDEVKSLIIYLKRKKQNVKDHRMTIYKLGDDFRMKLVKSEQFVNNIQYDLPVEKENVQDLKNTLLSLECKYDKLIEQSKEKDELIHQLKRKFEEENTKYMLDKVKHKRKREEISEKMSHELDSKLRRQREHIEATMKENLEKIELVKDILSDKLPPTLINK
ncbi:pavarotti [Carabus blaptoides fortunei]